MSSAGVVKNLFDLNAVEAAVQIKEKIGGTIITVSMGSKSDHVVEGLTFERRRKNISLK